MKTENNAKGPGSSSGSRGSRLKKVLVTTVLHIDDDANDTELLEAAMRKAKAKFILHNVNDGEQAMAYLNGHGVYGNRTRFQVPSLILLDLKMLRATGFEVLKWIRGHKLMGKLPIVVLSGSELQEDIQHAYAAGANSYLVKPLSFNGLVQLIREVEAKWVTNQPMLSLNAEHLGPVPGLTF